MCMDIEIQDTGTQDDLKTIIRNRISEGQTFESMAAVYRTIGLDSLGIRNLNGGKQCDTARAIVEQYARFELVSPNGRSVRCVEIFREPHYMEKTDGRGKNGYYVDRLIPLILRSLWVSDNEEWITSVKKLAVKVGLVKKNYSNFPKAKNYFDKICETLSISDFCLKQFYNRSQSELQPKIIGALDRLKKEGVLNYTRKYYIRQSDGNNHLSNDRECSMIKDTEKKIVEEMGKKNKRTIYLRNQGDEFEAKVLAYINETYDRCWELCVPILQLNFSRSKVNSYIFYKCPDIFKNSIEIATEVRKHFAQAIRKKTKRDYERTNRRLRETADEIFQELKIQEDMTLFLNENELKEKSLQFARQRAKGKFYFFWPKYLESQDKLTTIFIG